MSFFSNSVIQKLAQNPRWTINVDKKMPIDIQVLKKYGKIIGATSEQSLISLPELLDMMLPMQIMPKQFAYMLDVKRDNVVVLDIEPICPESLKKEMLNLDFLYGDISASGKGYHLIFPSPQLNEISQNKKVMKHPSKYCEILLNHYVTFTENVILPTTTQSTLTFQKIWNDLLKHQKILTAKTIDIDLTTRPKFNTKVHGLLRCKIIDAFNHCFTKTPLDYNNDMSRYEFGVIGAIRIHLLQLLEFSIFKNLQMDESDKIWMTYDIVCGILPHRDKHDEKRNGSPFLFYLVYKSFTTSS